MGSDHTSNIIGHDQYILPTPGNLSFTFANNIVFYGNIFEHLGAVGLQFGAGSRNNTINSNLFTDISSSAIEIGAVTALDAHPANPAYILSNHLITNNLITTVAVEFQDAAGIFVGFTQYTTISQNTIVDVPWSGIAIGWGWGLYDVGSYPGVTDGTSGMWGTYTTPTPNIGCQIVQNKIYNFLNILWDGGAIYTTGQQGPSLPEGLLIQGNVAYGKPATRWRQYHFIPMEEAGLLKSKETPRITIPSESPIMAHRRMQTTLTTSLCNILSITSKTACLTEAIPEDAVPMAILIIPGIIG